MDKTKRLCAILASQALQHPGESELQLLRRIDAQTVPLLKASIESSLPVTKETIEGFATLNEAIDEKLAEIGHPEFQGNDSVKKAKVFFKDPDTTLERSLTGLDRWEEIRRELWVKVK